MLDNLFPRRTKKKQKAEEYYKILGTTARASQDKIKEKYLEKVREFPPETHPDEFQMARRAYETLKDPVKRREYDIIRKFGPKIEKEMNRAMFHIMLGEIDKAHYILDGVIKIYPDSFQACLLKSELFIKENRIQDFQKSFEKVLELAPKDELETLHIIKIRMLTAHDYSKTALIELENAKKQFPNQAANFDELLISIYKDLGDFDNLWKIIVKLAPSDKEGGPHDIYLFMEWLVAAVELEKKSELSRIVTRIKKVIKLLEEEELEYFLSICMAEYHGYAEVARFADASVFLDLGCYIDKNNKELQRKKKELGSLVALDKAIKRLFNDHYIIPYVIIHALKLFYENHTSGIPEDILSEYYNIKSEMEDYHEDIAFGIVQLKKKYNVVHKAFQEEWDQLFQKHTAGLNREARRRIR